MILSLASTWYGLLLSSEHIVPGTSLLDVSAVCHSWWLQYGGAFLLDVVRKNGLDFSFLLHLLVKQTTKTQPPEPDKVEVQLSGGGGPPVHRLNPWNRTNHEPMSSGVRGGGSIWEKERRLSA